MYSLHQTNYSLFSSVVELLQWHMLEQSQHTGFLWAMTVLLERVNDLKLFKKILDLGLIHETLHEINNPQPKPKAKKKTKAKSKNVAQVKSTAKAKTAKKSTK